MEMNYKNLKAFVAFSEDYETPSFCVGKTFDEAVENYLSVCELGAGPDEDEVTIRRAKEDDESIFCFSDGVVETELSLEDFIDRFIIDDNTGCDGMNLYFVDELETECKSFVYAKTPDEAKKMVDDIVLSNSEIVIPNCLVRLARRGDRAEPLNYKSLGYELFEDVIRVPLK